MDGIHRHRNNILKEKTMGLMESERFKRTIDPYKHKQMVIQAASTTTEKIKDMTGKTGIAVTGFNQFQDRLRKKFPGLDELNKK